MTATDHTPRHASEPGRARRRWVPFAAAATVSALTVAAVAAAGGGTAGATASLPQAQSVGNFLDATLGGSTLDPVAKLQYAHAVAPGSNGVQNPLDVKVLNALELPLTGALQLPKIAGINLGAANQVAKANVDGSSYGASGAVNNSGGISVGGDNNAFPANASIDLCASAFTGGKCGTSPTDALGEAKVNLGAVSALASTPKGYGKPGSTDYQIANLNIQLTSPALGQLLGGVLSSVTTVLQQVATAAGAVTQQLTGCDLTSGTVPSTISLDNGTVVINPATAGLTIDLEKLLETLGLNLNNLPPNTDLVDFLLAYLADPQGLAKGVEGVINGLVDPLEAKYTACKTAINAIPVLGPTLTALLDALISGQATLESTVNQLVTTLSSAGGPNPLAPLAALLKALVDIGVNVQPNGPAGPAGAAYVDPLAKTPKQGTPVVPGQTIERAIEVNVAAGAGSSLGSGGLPGLGSLPLTSVKGLNQVATPKSVKAAATTSGSTGILTLALANAAAGPSNAPVAPPSSSSPPPSKSSPPSGPPTGVPAGSGRHGGSPVLPVTLTLLALILAAGGVTAYRMRGRYGQH